MSNIVINQVSVETRVVEVPDYTPHCDVITELNELNKVAVQEKARAIEVLGGSMLEQIGCYIYELLKPLMSIGVGVFAAVYSGGYSWPELELRLDDSGNGTLKVCDTTVVVRFNKDGYHIYEAGLRCNMYNGTSYALVVAKYWGKLRAELLRKTEGVLISHENHIKNDIRKAEEERSLIENFKL